MTTKITLAAAAAEPDPQQVQILRYAAFPDGGQGGNPAGVVLEASGLADARRLALASEVGYSETAFVEPGGGPGRWQLRFFSPRSQVAFCGHATIATAVALAERDGPGVLRLDTLAGEIAVQTRHTSQGYSATLTSVPTTTRPATAQELTTALRTLRWTVSDLDRRYPVHVANAGNDHLIVAVHDRARLANLRYDYDRLADVMAEHGWTTLQLVHAHSPLLFSARNPFPPGGVIEDPATGAAAAALGGYLRDLGLVELPAQVTVLQGHDMGRPSRLLVSITADNRVQLTGTATPITHHPRFEPDPEPV